MSSLEIALPTGHRLTSVRPEDAGEFVRLLADGEVSGFIPSIPLPYTDQSAAYWIRHRLAFRDKIGVEVAFVIRSAEGTIVGSVGVDDLVPGTTTHNGELGYWLGQDHRGRGIGRAAVRAFVSYAFDHLGLERLTAHTLHFNAPSVKLLTGIGFGMEGRLREYTRNASGAHDTLVFGLLKRDWLQRPPPTRAGGGRKAATS
jgi:[ribosomal protein S5]-alanine N-acetyltransferase